MLIPSNTPITSGSWPVWWMRLIMPLMSTLPLGRASVTDEPGELTGSTSAAWSTAPRQVSRLDMPHQTNIWSAVKTSACLSSKSSRFTEDSGKSACFWKLPHPSGTKPWLRRDLKHAKQFSRLRCNSELSASNFLNLHKCQCVRVALCYGMNPLRVSIRSFHKRERIRVCASWFDSSPLSL